jgi:D-alanyl-D-alanine carboxypeptidase/D-alanyl-D-alanine-endopeptidase (penicillin-binding protein 4)
LGSDVVRPGTDVVRPGGATSDGAAKAVAAVPEAPEVPLEPIRVILPVIPVKPTKQGFLDRLVAGKSDAERAAEEARKEEEARRKAEEAQRKADEKAWKEEEQARRKAEEKARKQAEEVAREQAEAEEKAQAKAEERARRRAEAQRRAQERARRAEERALKARADTDAEEDEDYADDFDEEEYDDEPRGLTGPRQSPQIAPPAPPRAPAGPGAPPRPGGPTAPPGPSAPPRPGARPAPGPARPLPGRRLPDRRGFPQGRGDRYDDDRYDEDIEVRRARRPLWQWAMGAFALVLLGSGSAAVVGVVAPPPTAAYQTGIDYGAPAPLLGDLNGGAPVPSRPGLEAVLGPLVESSGLGPNPSVSVADAGTGQALWDTRGDSAITPASSEKLLTAAAVLATRGPNYRIPTRAVAGATPGDVVLVGGGDPTLAIDENAAYRDAARLDDLAEQVRKALGGQAPQRVIVDGSAFSGSDVGPGWSTSDVNNGVIAHITALMTDGARVNPKDTRESPARFSQPDIAAGKAFARALGIPESQVQRGTATANAQVLGEVLSPPIAGIVERMLLDSDNTVAEMMAHQVALAKGMPATFEGAAQATRQVLADLGVPTPAGVGLVDGSGLSHGDSTTTNQLLAVLVKAASPEHPELRALISGLPVAGYSGTLDNTHHRGEAGRGLVRAKTGTLGSAGVNALAGYVVDVDGRLLAFAIVANGTPNTPAAEKALDKLALALGQCGCR